MRRRDFLAQLAAASLSLERAGNSFAYTKKKRRGAPSPPPKWDRIAISSWSLHNYFRSTRESSFNLPGAFLALLDFPEMIVERYKVRHFEFCATHFPSTEPAYLRELKYTLAHTLSTIVNLSVDIEECGPEGTFSDPDHEARLAALDAARLWVGVAHDLGVKSASVGPGKVDPENLERTAESYKALALYAQAKGVRVMVENQDGFGSDNPQEITKVLKLAGAGRLSALPNFANFTDEPTRQKGLNMLFPYAPSLCRVQGLEFDAAGAETGYDFPQAMAIARTGRFRGVYSIDFEGPGDPYAGIQKTLDELLKYL